VDKAVTALSNNLRIRVDQVGQVQVEDLRCVN